MGEYLFSKTIEVVADRARERETPAAFSDFDKNIIDRQLGSQDIPMVLNTSASVYATMQGGGLGDARINVRGFNQRNVAIMINGVPVNDMENGWVYWSNWDGVGDATSSIQIQRGLTAVNLATPSIGGTMNILTDPAADQKEIKYKQEIGNDGFWKSTIVLKTGLLNGKFAFNGALVRKKYDGIVDATWTDAWAYYLGGSWNVNETNRLELYALGAPQKHGQNLYKQNIAVYDKKYAEKIIDSSLKKKDSDNDGTSDWVEYFNQFHERGRKFNQNWSEINSDYNGKQAVGDETFNRYDHDFINERENFYHKPQVNLNWYSSLSENTNLYTILYYSGGLGGGTGLDGAYYRRDAAGRLGDGDWAYYNGPSPYTADLDETIRMNSGPAGVYAIDNEEYNKDNGQSLAILRNSRNNQWTVGAISKINYKISEKLQTTMGVDWRTAEIEHYREIRDLLGGRYFLSNDNLFLEGPDTITIGDKYDYYFTNTVNWYGGFAQSEYINGPLTIYGMFGLSTLRYEYFNHFLPAKIDSASGFAAPGSSNLTQKSDWILGGQVKGGLSYRLNKNLQIYGNAGYISKVPVFDAVINDKTGELIANDGNEKFVSVELGNNLNLPAVNLNLKTNFYYTTWKNRTVTDPEYNQVTGDEGIIVIKGMNAEHFGLEIEAAYQPRTFIRFDAAASAGNWKTTSDANALYKDYGNAPDSAFTIYIKNLKTGDAPQIQAALSASLMPLNGLTLQGIFRYYANHYADWLAVNRTNENDRFQSWKTPAYTLVDFHFIYTLPQIISGVELQLFGHVFNFFDQIYIQDAVDNSPYNAYTGDGKNHKADDAEVFPGLPRTFNAGFSIIW
ncbi:MAG: TonB-dependent receptor plug domain-containing protein [Calditrichaceae bacterium]